MNNKGWALFEVIITIFIIGLVTVSFLPILGSSHKTVSIIKLQDEIAYLGEHIFERLYSKDEYVKELLSEIEKEIEFIDLEDKYIQKYRCKIINMDFDEYLWNFKVIVELRDDKGEGPYVELSGTVPK